MARFTTAGGSGDGAPGPQGPAGNDGADGADGADALWNFLGEYDNGADYSIGDVVTFAGGTYYRIGEPNPGYPPGTSYWTTIAEPGTDGADGSDGEDGQDAEAVSETSFTVNGGTLGVQPTFTGAPLFSGSYVKTGPMVHFQIQVDMDNITNFGTGQYYIDLPLPSKYGYQVKSGCFHDISTDKQYAIGGHVFAGQSQLTLTFTNSAGQDEAFDYNSPVTLNVADNFHISGTYITN